MARGKGLLLYAPPEQQVPVRFVKGVGQKAAKTLSSSRFAITSVQELIQHYPRRHLDFSETKSIREVGVGDEVTVIGAIHRVQRPPPNRPKIPLRATVSDGTSKLPLVFFNQPWRAQQLRPGVIVAAKGKITTFRGKRQMTSPMVDVLKEEDEVMKIVPVYPATADIHTAWLRRIIRAALDAYSPLTDPLPRAIQSRRRLMDRTEAMYGYHFPQDFAERSRARHRLVFDELFTLQIGLAYRKRRVESQTEGISHRPSPPAGTDGGQGMPEEFLEALPFSLTAAQERAIKEIAEDLARPVPMNRLLQGEVGSGKTVVALHAALAVVAGGHQVAIMAPTEVLASQHFLTISELLQPLTGGAVDASGQMELFGGPGVVLLTGSVPAARRREALARIADGSAGIVVGTHALIQEGVGFQDLGLAIVDEQHRFGVHQRVALRQASAQGAQPDVLIMTATPIPRTLALTLYGDLEVSVLDELPEGRLPVETRVVEEAGREGAYELVRREVADQRQAYVITPLVDESDKLEVRSAEEEAERLATEVFPDLRVGKLHGRMRPAAKEGVMADFRAGEIDVLISTTVVEVGVDVPNATVMLIEDADRFGLSQLHQLRGRIGRSSYASTCLLMTSIFEDDDPEARADARRRLEAVASTTDGFELAAKDLEIRGAGTILGARQAGWSDLRLTDLLRDVDILKVAREDAFALIEEDPELVQNPLIRTEMEGRFADRLEWLFHS